jgi:predicted GH43/DUF377 family glycosyl hydrolase
MIMRHLFLLAALFWAAFCFADSSVNLESQSQDFILETKQVEIPGYPDAFNPSIIKWRGQMLMSFRIIPERKRKYDSEIGLVFLNNDFEPMNTPQLLCLRDEFSTVPCRAEDARLLAIGDRLFAIYDDNREKRLSKGGFRLYVAELIFNGEHFVTGDVECLCHYEGETRELREKAWVPFEYQGNMLLAYSLNPHKIFCPRLDGSGVCDTVALSDGSINWNFGILRGGTPGLIEGDEYLAFFHSSKEIATHHSDGNKILHYFIGAYTFSKNPPFAITKISPSPIVGKGFYSGPEFLPYFKPVRCVFPCGYITEGPFIYLAYGRDDHECWIAKIDKHKLLNSLVEVAQK